MELLLFFCAAAKEVQRIFPVIYDTYDPNPSEKKASIGAVKKEAINFYYWEIVAIKVAELGVFNTGELSPLELVMNKRAYDVLKVYNLKLTQL